MTDTNNNGSPRLDLSDVEHRVGKLVGGGQLWEPCAKSDIRRWVMAMDYVNPIHWDQKFASQTKFGDIVAPMSVILPVSTAPSSESCCDLEKR